MWWSYITWTLLQFSWSVSRWGAKSATVGQNFRMTLRCLFPAFVVVKHISKSIFWNSCWIPHGFGSNFCCWFPLCSSHLEAFPFPRRTLLFSRSISFEGWVAGKGDSNSMGRRKKSQKIPSVQVYLRNWPRELSRPKKCRAFRFHKKKATKAPLLIKLV